MKRDPYDVHGERLSFRPLAAYLMFYLTLFCKIASHSRGRHREGGVCDYKEAPRCGDKKCRRVETAGKSERGKEGEKERDRGTVRARVQVSGDHPLQQRAVRVV